MVTLPFILFELFPLELCASQKPCPLYNLKTAQAISTKLYIYIPGCIAQSVTCLATDASLTSNPGVQSSILARSHTFMEIDHEMISMVILFPSAESFKKCCCQLQAKVCARSTGYCLFKLAQEKAWLGELTVPP